MISSYIEILLSCLIFWVTYFFCAKKKQPVYTGFELLLFYFFARVFPVLMLPERTRYHLLCLSAEWVLMALLYYYLSQSKSPKMQHVILGFYLFNPALAVLVLTASIKGICVGVFVLLLLCVADRILEKRQISLLAFWPEYLLLGTGISVLLMAKNNIYGMCMTGLAVAGTVSRLVCLWKNKIQKRDAVSEEEETAQEPVRRSQKFTGWDFACMAAITLLFAVAVLWKLGSHHTPETFASFRVGNPGENEIVLQFGKETEISDVFIYLGYKGKRIVSFSALSEGSTAWEVFDSRHSVESVFCWNRVAVNRSMHSLGMVLMEGEADFCEVVCLDRDGQVILPINSADYPLLFDEQDLFRNPATYYDGTMFDEVYHGRTAYEFLHELPIYENTHPPLGKSIISIGIALFGMNPFGFRIMCALFGIGMIPLMYLFAHKMFGRTGVSCFASVLLATAFMNTTLSRIATLDILVAFFVLGMFYFMYGYTQALQNREPFFKQMLWLFNSGLFMAFAISIKWTGFYGAAGIAILFFAALLQHMGGILKIREHMSYLVKTAGCCVLFFILIPVVIYTLSYLPFPKVYTDKGLIQHMIDNATLMLNYHKDCVFEHPYSSEWYKWLIDARPLADSRVYLENGTVSTVMTFFNPLLCLGGLFAFLHQFYLRREKKCTRAVFLIVGYLSMLLPWLIIHRTIFIYQYFVSGLFLVLMVANSLSYSRHPKRNMAIFSVLSVILYAMYYPVLTGQPVKVSFINQVLELFTTWNIA